MFDLFRKENATQEARLLKHLMRNEGKEVTLSSIVIGLKIFHHTQIIKQLRAKGLKEGFTIPKPRREEKRDNFWNCRIYYKLIKD